jgi:bifunctional non-homologous end joining protein LigD
VLVRMKNDRTGGTRANWLLIKHHDDAARDGGGDAILAEDRSVASGRAMEVIAAGKGKSPKPFMTQGDSSVAADAVWDSSNGLATRKRTVGKTSMAESANHASSHKKNRNASAVMPDFVAPQLCTRVERPPNEPGRVHEIKFDGYRIQLRIERGKVTLKTRNGLDWTTKFGAIAKGASDLPGGNRRA